ncbi:MAG: DotU family type IV/VI secretion system protein [Aquabacterium sp.]|nr:MAG: DotU family type IV/VI secretion system protein [Aquabacterium sp.]
MSKAPTLFADTVIAEPPAPSPAASAAQQPPAALLDLMYDGFYMVFLLKNRHLPSDAATFRERIQSFLLDLERAGLRLQLGADDVHEAKFAFCALVDEIVLRSVPRLRDDWERYPLQLQFFGEQLAGEQFFTRLEDIRGAGAARVQVLEVYHLCLLLGFQGRYLLEGSEKLAWLTARLGDEIVHLKGRRAPFAPHWAPPERIVHALKHQVPMWVLASVFALLGLAAFIGLRWSLGGQAKEAMAGYTDVIKLPPRTAWINITLP